MCHFNFLTLKKNYVCPFTVIHLILPHLPKWPENKYIFILLCQLTIYPILPELLASRAF